MAFKFEAGLHFAALSALQGFLLWVIVKAFQTRRQKSLLLLEQQGFKDHPARRIKAQSALGFKLALPLAFEKRYLMDTGLWQHFPFLRAAHVLTGCVLSGLAFGWGIWHLFRSEGMVVSGFLMGALLPLQLAELAQLYRYHRLIGALPGFFGVLLRWAQIQPDLYFCFAQLEQSGIQPLITKPFQRFLAESTGGVSKERAFERLSDHFEGTMVSNFVKCAARLVDQRGDLPKLIQGFEEESYQLQMEISKRQMTQLKYKLLIHGLCLGAFVLIYALLKTNRVMAGFYAETAAGKGLLFALSLLVVASFAGGLRYDRI